MAATANTTKLANLFDPEVVGDAIDSKLINAIRFAPLARIDTTLVGRAGDELTMPYYEYIGAATDVNEGADIPISLLSQKTRKVKVTKIGKAVQFTDEAMLSGFGDVAAEAARQVVLAINDKVEAKLLADMSTNATLTGTITAAGTGTDGAANDIADALVKFGEDIDGEKVLLIPATLYARLRKTANWIPNTEVGADAIIRGTVGMIHGCQVAVSNRLTDEAYIVKPGALAIVMKRDILVEYDRDIIDETNVIKASKLFAPYLYDANKLIKLTIGA